MVNPELDLTKFVNIDEKPFDIYIGGKLVRHIEAGETHTLVVYVAQVGAKHLVDRVLQEKHGVSDSLRDTPLRKSLFAKILPEMAEERDIKPLTPDEEKVAVKKQLDEQAKVIDSLLQKKKDDDERDKKIAELEKRLAELSAPKVEPEVPQSEEKPKVGRPRKVAE